MHSREVLLDEKVLEASPEQDSCSRILSKNHLLCPTIRMHSQRLHDVTHLLHFVMQQVSEHCSFVSHLRVPTFLVVISFVRVLDDCEILTTRTSGQIKATPVMIAASYLLNWCVCVCVCVCVLQPRNDDENVYTKKSFQLKNKEMYVHKLIP